MTGNLSLLAPAMIVVAISTAIVGDNTIYRSQLKDRASSPAHRLRFSFPLLSSLSVRDAMTPCKAVLPADAPVSSAEPLLNESAIPGLALVRQDGSFAGLVTRQQIERLAEPEKEQTPLSEVIHPDSVVLDPEDRLDAALERISVRGLSWAPVFEGGAVAGKLTVKDAITVYRATLEKSIRRTTELPGDTVLIQARLSPTSPLLGKRLREAGFPLDTLLVSIMRGGDTIFPRADTRLEPGDLVTIMADSSSEKDLRIFLGEAVSPAEKETSFGLVS
jgi:chloride channel protein, CIC family